MHELVRAAASGTLPDWAVAGPRRREHMARVADLLGGWATALGLSEDEAARWRAVGYLHDVVRDADPAELRDRIPPVLHVWPDLLLHGPAGAELMRTAGVMDGELLDAVAFHTLGHPGFRRLGRALYAADFLDPGRPFLPEWRAELRERVPDELDTVVFEILRARLRHLLDRGLPILPRTMEFWNQVAGEQG